MKKLIVFSLSLFLSLYSFAQDSTDITSDSYHSVGVRFLFLNQGIVNGDNSLKWTNGVSLEYGRSFGKYFALAIPLRYGVFQVKDDINNRRFAGVDLLAQVQLEELSPSFIPYFFAGGAGVYEESKGFYYQIPAGLGVKVKVSENTYVNLQADYRYAMEENRSGVQGGLGINFRFKSGLKDSDKDGIPDEEDACPNEAGTIELKGCPDSDGDGIVDNEDECPNEIGFEFGKGCPDRDGDGVHDYTDQCPDIPGLPKFNGCSDSDSDGISDDKDFCPNEFGPVNNLGCPVKDEDGDGVPDEVDECPSEKGSRISRGCPDMDSDGIPDKYDQCPDLPGFFNGCPSDVIPEKDEAGNIVYKSSKEVTTETKMVLEYAKEEIRFDFNKIDIKPEFNWILDRIVDILNQYPDYFLRIGGHTDSVGDEAYNQMLSERRVKSVYTYLVDKGIPQHRMVYFGFGESRPRTTNKTSVERQLNRRVEFELFLE